MSFASPALLALSCASDPVQAPPVFRYASRSALGSRSYGNGDNRSKKKSRKSYGVLRYGAAARARLNR